MQPETSTRDETGSQVLRRVRWGTRDWWQTIWANARGSVIHQPKQLTPFRSRYVLTVRVISSVLDLRGSWYTTGHASCRLLKPSRWWYAALILLPSAVLAPLGSIVLTIGGGAALLWWPIAFTIGVTPAAGVRTTRDATGFPCMPDRMSESVTRHPGAPPGAGVHLIQACHQLADHRGWIIGGKADNQDLADRVYLRAGRRTPTTNKLLTWYQPPKRLGIAEEGGHQTPPASSVGTFSHGEGS